MSEKTYRCTKCKNPLTREKFGIKKGNRTNLCLKCLSVSAKYCTLRREKIKALKDEENRKALELKEIQAEKLAQAIREAAIQPCENVQKYKDTKLIHYTERPICKICGKPRDINSGSIFHSACKRKQDNEIAFRDYSRVGMF